MLVFVNLNRIAASMLAIFTVSALAAERIPVFSTDIAPMLYSHCASCHHAGEVAPFPLLSYQDAAKRAKLISEVTRTRYMPPWKPVYASKLSAHFEGERRLTDSQIATLTNWAAAGAPEGDPAKTPVPPVFNSDWKLGKPDLIVELPQPFNVPAEGSDVYQCFVVPLHLDANTNIRAVEFRPSNRRVVHHALLFTDTSHIALKSNYSCFGSIGVLPTSGLGGWSPGNGPVQMLDGAAIPIQKGSRLVAQVHYHPTGKPEEDKWSAGFYFTEKAAVRRVVDVGLSSRQIDIPAGDAHYVVRDHFTLPVPVWAVGVIPHAHYVCREMHGVATLPNGTKINLLDIVDWDFNWQDQYRYQQPILLPEDTRIEMEFVYDNSAANPRNPHSPPQRVTWGPGVDDEMAGFHLQSIPVHMEDIHELGQALWGKVMRSVGGSFYRPPQ